MISYPWRDPVDFIQICEYFMRYIICHWGLVSAVAAIGQICSCYICFLVKWFMFTNGLYVHFMLEHAICCNICLFVNDDVFVSDKEILFIFLSTQKCVGITEESMSFIKKLSFPVFLCYDFVPVFCFLSMQWIKGTISHIIDPHITLTCVIFNTALNGIH